MKTKTLLAIVIFITIASGNAMAANDFTVTLGSQYKLLMGEGTGVVEHTITNDPTSTRALERIIFDLDASGTDNYDFLSFTPPAGWSITAISADSITVQANSNGDKLAAGASLTFALAFAGEGGGTIPSSATDASLSSDSLYQISCYFGTGTPGGWVVKTGAAASPDWTRIGLKVSINATPSSTNPASGITVVMTVTNRTSVTKNGITSNPSDPTMTYGGPGSISKNTGPTAALNLASGSSGTITWIYWANSSSSGTVYWSGGATHNSGETTGASVQSNTVTIANFAATLSIDKTSVVTNEIVTVTMTVTNNGTSSLTSIVPSALTGGGTAIKTLSSGPTPASIASLAPGASGNFQWTYTITGTVGQTYSFSGNATATGPITSNTATTSTGSIVTISASISPVTSAAGSTNVTYTFTIKNDSNRDINTFWVTYPSGFTYSSASGGGWTVDATSAPTIKFTAGTVIAKNGGIKSDFQLTFSSIPSPSSNTDYDFSVKTIDTFANEWNGTCRITVTAYSIIMTLSPNDSSATAIDADGAGVTTLKGTVITQYASGSDLSANGTTTVTSASATFTTTLAATDRLYIAGRGIYTVLSVTNDTTLVLSATVASGSGLSYKGGPGKSGFTVNFSATNGTLQSSSAVTNSSGDATVNLTAPSSTTDTTGNCTATYTSYSDAKTAYWKGYSAPSLLYVGGTLHTIPNNNPADRMTKQGSSYQLTVDVQNQSSTTGMTCYAASTHIYFTDGTDTYDAYLASDTAVAASATVTLTFASTMVSSNVDLGKYQPTLYINAGQGTGSPNYEQTRSITDYIYVLQSTDAFIGRFSTKSGKGSIMLKWRTIQESQNAGFNVYRADVSNTAAGSKHIRVWYNLDGANMSKVNNKLIGGMGTSDKQNDYYWVDTNISAGKVYLYAIESVSFSGSKILHKPYLLAWPVGEKEKESDEDLSEWTGVDGGRNGGADRANTTAGEIKYFGELSIITSEAGSNGILLSWVFPNPSKVVGYDIYRADISKYDASFRAKKIHVKFNEDEFVRLSGSQILALGHDTSAPFQYFDTNVLAGHTYLYMVASLDISGKIIRYRPYVAAEISSNATVTAPNIVNVVLPQGGNNVRWPGLDNTDDDDKVVPEEEEPNPPVVVRVTKGYLEGEAIFKILVKEEGFYEIDRQKIAEMGLDSSKAFHLYYNGKKVAVQRINNSEGQLSAFRFYAEKHEDLYSDVNAYWLVQRAAEEGDDVVTMKSDDGDNLVAGANVISTYQKKIKLEENTMFYRGLPGGLENEDHWFFSVFLYDTASVTRNAEVHNIDAAAPKAYLTVSLRGITSFPDVAGDHHIKAYLNGSFVGDIRWDGLTVKTQRLEVDSYIMQDGNNEIKLVCPGDTGAAYEYVFIDWLELEYTSKTVAESGVVKFTVNSVNGETIAASGFGSSDLIVLDITNTSKVSAFDKYSVRNENGTATVSFKASNGTHSYYVLENQALKTPEQIIEHSVLNLKNLKADYIIISHKDFIGELAPLVNLHRSGGLTVEVVDVQSVYDEFGYGKIGPDAIRAFFAAVKPKYALLVGDTTYDYRDYEGKGVKNFIPSFFSESDDWYSTNDNRFACIEGDDFIPDIAIGRFPVNTAEECRNVVAKVLAYASQGGGTSDAMLVADADENFFQTNAEELGAYLSGWRLNKIYMKNYGNINDVKTDIREGINSGTNLVVYVGHGAIGSWESAQILKNADMELLTNSDQLAVFIQFTCLSNYFSHTNKAYNSLGETLLLAPGKGAVASFSSTGRSTPGTQFIMGKEIIKQLGKGDIRLGDAVLSGKQVLGKMNGGDGKWVLESFILLGDPALPIRGRQQ